MKSSITGLKNHSVDTLIPFQGDLKSLSDTNKVKLKKTLLELDFTGNHAVPERTGQRFDDFDNKKINKALRR